MVLHPLPDFDPVEAQVRLCRFCRLPRAVKNVCASTVCLKVVLSQAYLAAVHKLLQSHTRSVPMQEVQELKPVLQTLSEQMGDLFVIDAANDKTCQAKGVPLDVCRWVLIVRMGQRSMTSFQARLRLSGAALPAIVASMYHGKACPCLRGFRSEAGLCQGSWWRRISTSPRVRARLLTDAIGGVDPRGNLDSAESSPIRPGPRVASGALLSTLPYRQGGDLIVAGHSFPWPSLRAWSQHAPVLPML